MKHLIINILAFLILLPGVSLAQKDSIAIYHNWAETALKPEKKLEYCTKMMQLAEKYNDTLEMMQCCSMTAYAYFYLNDINSAIECYKQEYQLAILTNNQNHLEKSLYNLAGSYSVKLDYTESLRLYKKSLKVITDSFLVALVYRDMSSLCASLKLYESSNANLRQAMEIDKNLNDSMGLTQDYSIMAQNIVIQLTEDIYSDDHAWDPDFHNSMMQASGLLDSMMIYKPHDIDELDEATLMVQYYLGQAQKCIHLARRAEGSEKKKLIEQAKEVNQKFLETATAIEDYDFINEHWLMTSELEFMEGHTERAVFITDSLKSVLSDTLWPLSLQSAYKKSVKYNTKLKRYEKALDDFLNYDRLRMKSLNDNILLSSAEFRSDIRNEENISRLMEEQEKEKLLHDEEVKRQKQVTALISVILLLLFATTVMIWQSLRRKRRHLQKVNEINAQLSLQQEEIKSQRDVINTQKEKVEKANSIMTQSITYARHIQHAALPSHETVKKIFPEHFIYYMPKDIVSGDFYYTSQNGGWNTFVMADCTGHGVPGGFLSMMGISALQEILRDTENEVEPGVILDKMRAYVKQALSNDEEIMQVTINGVEEMFSTADGMDMSIVSINNSQTKLKFAGAYQNICIVNNSGTQRLKGDRMPVGRHINDYGKFTTHTLDIHSGDMVYLCSDGIASQISQKGVKFMTKRVLDFFTENHNLPCSEQKEKMEALMKEWRANTIQIDDQSLVGIRIQ